MQQFDTFAAFYAFYLKEHSNRTCRRLHVLGSLSGIACLLAAIVTAQPLLLLAALGIGYLLAWIGHFVFERNRPATFLYPLRSFACDWLMLRDIILGRIPF